MVKQLNIGHYAFMLIASLLLVRLISLGLYPLFDTTEARYGEIARIMFETQNWVTPQFDYNIPFWGKPPLHTWMSAASFSIFGVSEFTARLPHFIAGLLIVFLVYRFAENLGDKRKALIAAMVLCSCLGFIIAIGMVMTDTALLLSITLAMTSFWYCFTGKSSTFHGNLFFAALAIGMLAKGPVAIVLVGISLVVWSLYTKQLRQGLACLPWLSGLTIFLAITLPWYVWAEIRTPGFINYFIVGEHFYRFVESGWTGDLYGSAHDQPKGMIWLFWLVAAFPWSFYLIYLTVKTKRFSADINPEVTPLVPYLVAWCIAPMLLFTMAGNILPIYVMPGFTAMSLLIALSIKSVKKPVFIALTSFCLVATTLTLVTLGVFNKSSESELLGQDRSFDQNARLYYWKNRPFSAQFYSKGQAQLVAETQQLSQLVHGSESFFLVLSKDEYAKFKEPLLQSCRQVAQSSKRVQLECN